MGTPLTPVTGEALGPVDVEAREDAGQEIEILNELGKPVFYAGPEGQPLPVTMTVVGSYSSRYRKCVEDQQDRITLSRRRSKNISATLRQNALEQTATCVIAWKGVNDASGQPAPCTFANVLTLLKQKPWIRDQVAEAMEDHEGFLKSSSPS